MAILDKTQDGTDNTAPSTVLPSRYPELPDDVVKRFPSISDWQDEQRRLFLLIKQSLEATVTDLSAPIQALQKDQFNLSVSLGGFTASITTETTARITADTALASTLTTLTATVATNLTTVTSLITVETTARSTADTALASQITTLTATVATNLSTVNASIATEISARSTADTALATSITTLTATVTTDVTTINAAISTEITARSTADTALASSITTLTATVTTDVATLSSAISTETTARTTADAALASSITTVIANYTAADTTISASVTTETSARIAADGSIAAHWGVNLDVNGNVAGFVHLDGTSASSTFSVAVDKFVVTNVNGTIVALDIRAGGKIVFGADIQSDNYVAGSAGWWIGRNSGNAEFNNATIRGTLNAADLTAGTIPSARLPAGIGPVVSNTINSSYTTTLTGSTVATSITTNATVGVLCNVFFSGRFANNGATNSTFSATLYIDGSPATPATNWGSGILNAGSSVPFTLFGTFNLTAGVHTFTIYITGFPENVTVNGILTIQ